MYALMLKEGKTTKVTWRVWTTLNISALKIPNKRSLVTGRAGGRTPPPPQMAGNVGSVYMNNSPRNHHEWEE